MNRRLRIGTGLATVLLLCATFGAPTQAAGWKDLPEDVVLAVHFDMRSLAASELYQSLVDQYGSGIPNPKPEYMEFIEATGFDLEEDLESVTIGAGMPDGTTEGAFYMVIRGAFDRRKIDAYLQQSGKANQGTHGKLTTYVPREITYDGPEPMVSWIDDRTMILASTPDFPKLARSVNGPGLTAKNSALGRLLTRAHGQFYIAIEIPQQVPGSAGTPDGPARGLSTILAQLQNPAAGPMQNLESLLLTLDADSGLELALNASTDSDDNGRQVYEMLSGYLSIGRSMAAQNPQAAGIMEHLELARDGSNVEIRISMSGADVRAALQQSHAIADD